MHNRRRVLIHSNSKKEETSGAVGPLYCLVVFPIDHTMVLNFQSTVVWSKTVATVDVMIPSYEFEALSFEGFIEEVSNGFWN